MNTINRAIFATVLAVVLTLPSAVLGRSLPQKLEHKIDSIVEAGLKLEYYPGAAVVIGNSNGMLYNKCFGYQDDSKKVEVTQDDIYDLASVTKVVSTTLVVMALYDSGEIDLNRRVKDYIDIYNGSPVAELTITQLLTHTSGLPYIPIYSLLFENSDEEGVLISSRKSSKYPRMVDQASYLCADPIPVDGLTSFKNTTEYRRAGENLYVSPKIDSVICEAVKESYTERLRGRYRYSDTNFLILRQIVEAITGETLDVLAQAYHHRLEMYNTGYSPLEWKVPEMIIPTEMDYLTQRGLLRGYVHDDLAASSGGVEGNAGLFSNAPDLAKFCQMMLNEGNYRGDRIISRQTVGLFTSSPLEPRRIYRGLGFDKRRSDTKLGKGYGHTGFTGTMIWMDPESDIYMVFLCNRVNPTRLNRGISRSEMRTVIWELLTDSK